MLTCNFCRLLLSYTFGKILDMTRLLTRSLIFVSFLSATFPANAQTDTTTEAAPAMTGGGAPAPPARFYWSTGVDAFIFSSSHISKPSGNDGLSTLRFSYILNVGFHYNYDFSRHVGLFTGIGIKNIGFIDKVGDSTIKRRVYTIGAPLGIKFGNLPGRTYGFVGGGIDVPFNYREKGFRKRGDKEKFNEWFSDRTPRVLPYVFVGFTAIPSLVSVKFQYYPGNFMNEDFVQDRMPNKGQKIYHDYKVNLFYVSLGLDIKYGGRKRAQDDE